MDRYLYERLNGIRKQTASGVEVQTDPVRTRTIYAGDLVKSTLLRATTMPLFARAHGKPLNLDKGSCLADKCHGFDAPELDEELVEGKAKLARDRLGPQMVVVKSKGNPRLFQGNLGEGEILSFGQNGSDSK